MELAGGLVIEDPEFTVVTPNITQDPETGIGAWSDQEIITAIREGRRPDGSIIGPPMPIGLYREMSDQDVGALVAYLRAVPPVRNAVPRAEYPFPLPESYGGPVGRVAEVARDDPAAYGAYLAGPLGHCIECHTPLVDGRADFAARLGMRRQCVPRAMGRIGRGQHHLRPAGRPRQLERRRDQARDHPGHRRRRRAAQAADGVPLLRQHGRGRCRRAGGLSAHHPAARRLTV